MKIKIEKSYANCYYIMLLSIFITGYTLRSSILPGVFGYINFAFYISMFIILMRWIKYFNIRHIMIISAIFGGILYVDIMTGSNIYKSINSIFGFVLPLLLFCINYKRVIIDEELFITKCIKIVNFFTIVIFIYIVIDMVTNCLLTRTLSIIFPKLVEYIPKDTGFLKFRSASYLGHELYTKHFILMFYILNMLYHAIKLKYLMNPIIIHIIVMIGMVFSGSKIGILIVLFLILYFNFKNRNRIINITLIFLGLLILGYLGLFDYIINRFTTTTLAPKGKFVKTKNVIKNDNNDIRAEDTITFLNFLNTCIDDNAGKIIILEISNVPIIRIPITIVMAVSEAKSILNNLVFVPVALAKGSSNVTANILL